MYMYIQIYKYVGIYINIYKLIHIYVVASRAETEGPARVKCADVTATEVEMYTQIYIYVYVYNDI